MPNSLHKKLLQLGGHRETLDTNKNASLLKKSNTSNHLWTSEWSWRGPNYNVDGFRIWCSRV